MKYLCIAVMILSSAKSYSQAFGMNDWDVQFLEYVPIRYYPETNVSKITFSKLNKKKEVIETYLKEYNSAGKMTLYIIKNKKGEEIESITFSYNEEDLITEMIRKRKGKLKTQNEYAYTKDEKPLSSKKVDGSGKIIYNKKWIYGESDCLKEFVLFKKGGEKIKNKWVHEYRDDCERSKSTLYKGNGKIKNVWTYDCKSEGEILIKKKNETQVCRWEEVNAETITKVYQTFDEKGKIVKNVSKYTAGDTLLLEWARYDENDQLKNKSTYDRDYKKLLSSTSYKKGKPWYDTQITYKNGKVISKKRSRNGNIYGVSEYTYNKDGLLSAYLGTRGNGKTYSSYTLSYD